MPLFLFGTGDLLTSLMIQKYRHHSLPVYRVQRRHGAPGAYLYRKLLAGYATYTHIFPSPVKSKVTRQLIYDDHRPCTHTCMYLFIYLILIYFLYIFIFFLSNFFFLSFFLSYSFFLSFFQHIYHRCFFAP